MTFRLPTDTLRTFIAFIISNARIPIIKPAIVPNQNLHASDPADMIIVTHPSFRPYAEAC